MSFDASKTGGREINCGDDKYFFILNGYGVLSYFDKSLIGTGNITPEYVEIPYYTNAQNSGMIE